MEKFVNVASILFSVMFALLTGNALAHLQHEQVIRFGCAGIVCLIVAILGAITKD